MTDLPSLYAEAEDLGIEVDDFPMGYAEALSIPMGRGAIALDPFKLKSVADEKYKLAHEMGHCVTWSFYNRFSPFDVVEQHERRAEKWAIKKLVPKDELFAQFRKGIVASWELAEFFNVPEAFLIEAVEYYRSKDFINEPQSDR